MVVEVEERGIMLRMVGGCMGDIDLAAGGCDMKTEWTDRERRGPTHCGKDISLLREHAHNDCYSAVLLLYFGFLCGNHLFLM